jgi:hypothetical protein
MNTPPAKLDPATSYYVHEGEIIDNIYEPPYEYHHLKRRTNCCPWRRNPWPSPSTATGRPGAARRSAGRPGGDGGVPHPDPSRHAVWRTIRVLRPMRRGVRSIETCPGHVRGGSDAVRPAGARTREVTAEDLRARHPAARRSAPDVPDFFDDPARRPRGGELNEEWGADWRRARAPGRGGEGGDEARRPIRLTISFPPAPHRGRRPLHLPAGLVPQVPADPVLDGDALLRAIPAEARISMPSRPGRTARSN